MNVAFTVVEAGGLVLLIVLGMRSERFGDALHADVGTGRTIPRAILVSVAVTTAIYVLVGLAAVALVPAAEMAKSEVLLVAAAQAASQRAAGALGIIALFATANTCTAMLVGVSRMCHGMARAAALPGVLGRVLGIAIGAVAAWRGGDGGLAGKLGRTTAAQPRPRTRRARHQEHPLSVSEHA